MNRRGFLLGALAATTCLTPPALLPGGPYDQGIIWAYAPEELWPHMMAEGADLASVGGAHTSSLCTWSGINWIRHGDEAA